MFSAAIFVVECVSSLDYLNASLLLLCWYVPDEGSLLPTYRDCSTPEGYVLCLMSCGVMFPSFTIYMCVCLYIYIYVCVYLRDRSVTSKTS